MVELTGKTIPLTDKDTIIVVGVTELDEYNNLFVTPQGRGERIKISAKREHLHPLFEQGKAILLHWETYRGIAYVSDAKEVEGELPPPQTPQSPALHPDEPKELPTKYAPQEIGMWWKELGERIGDGSLEKDYPKSYVKIKGYYYKKMSEVTGVPFKE